ncbi:MAG: nucleoside-triphosphatase [Salinivirgaceae bacterium]
MKTFKYIPLNAVWLKAAVVGSVWASIEIVLGSFLHNMKVPMSGTFLSFLSVFLLVAYAQIWNERGLIIRAGLICALMKSISPSAIIIGPMTGILAEALLLELSIRLLGRNVPAYLIGGALAVFSSLAHKAVSLLLYYGFDFVYMLSQLYNFALKQLKLVHLGEPIHALLILTLIYLLAGFFAAFLGLRAGAKSKNTYPVPDELEIPFERQQKIQPVKTGSGIMAYVFLLAHVSLIVLTLWMLNKSFLLSALSLGVAYLAFCFIYYRQALSRLKKPGIWIQFVLITLFAALVWNVFNGKSFFSLDGIIIGLKMIFRAVLIMVGFTAIGTELKNPSIKLLLYNKGFKNLYHAIDLAFSALPFLISQINVAQKGNNSLKKTGLRFLANSQRLLELFTRQNTQKPSVIIITGDVHQGKTSFTRKLSDLFVESGLAVSGFLTLRNEENQADTSYQLFSVETQQALPFIDTRAKANWFPFRRFYFNPEAFAFGHELIASAIAQKKSPVIIDELGPMELMNQGWSKSVEKLCHFPSIILVWVVRKKLVPLIRMKWDVGTVYLADIGSDTPEVLFEKIKELQGL